jgi:hypothetical protein
MLDGFAKREVNPNALAARPVRGIALERGYRRRNVMNEWTNAKYCDVANLILGALLFVSPWLFAFDEGLSSQNAIISGIAIAVLSVAALANFAVWEEWLNLIVGLWVVVSPWLMDFQGTTAMAVHVIIGIIVAVLAAIELWIMYQNPPRQTAIH